MQKGTPGCTRTFPTYIAFSPTSARPPQCIQPLYQACKSIAFSTSSILGSAALHNRHRRGAYTHIGAQPPCSTNIMPMMQHVHRGSRPHRSFHHTVGTIVPWTVLHDVNPSCPIVTTVAPLLFSFFTYHHLVFILQGCHVVLPVKVFSHTCSQTLEAECSTWASPMYD
jgi:hypothetical protein